MKTPIKKNKLKCYLCQSPDISLAYLKLNYQILKCPKCGLHFLKFEQNYQQFIENYYQKGFFKGDKRLRAYADYEGDKNIELKNMGRYLNHIRQFKKNGNLLDVGCALGYLLEIAQKKGFNVYGIDISKYAVDIARKKFGNHIYHSALSEAKLPSKYFDAITLFDLIEHLNDPAENLRNLRLSLKDDGILVLQTGDLSSFWANLNRINWHFLAPPQHLFFFDQKTITSLLSKAGFKVLKIEKHGKWISLRYLFHMMRYINQHSIGDFFYSLVKNNFLGKIPLYLKFYDNMIVYAEKNLAVSPNAFGK